MPSPSPTSNVVSSGKRLDSIDALRGVAALMVAGYHIWGHYGVYPFPSLGVVPQTTGAGLFAYLVSPLRWGYLGVSLFLVLSGFCIHLPFARKRKEQGRYNFSARQFYLRRLWRLYPAYAASVVGTFLLLQFAARGTTVIAGAPSWTDLLAHLTLTHGYFDNYFYGIVTVYWSLALEFQLYLAYPLFLYLFRKVGLTRAILALTIFSIAWRIVSMTVFHHQLISVAWTGPYPLMGFLFARMPEWLCGVWLAEWFVSERNQTANRTKLSIAASGTLFLAILSTLSQSLWSLTDILFGLGFGLVVAAAITPSKKPRPAKAPFRSIVWVGTISYSVYLFHMQLSWIANVWIQKLPGSILPFALRTFVLALSIGIIAFIFRIVEAPFLKAPQPGERYFTLYSRIRRALGIKQDTMIAMQSA